MNRASAFLLMSILTCGAASADVVYAVNSDGDFGSINLTTGAFTGIGVISPRSEGLGDAGGTLYGAPLLTQQVVSINPANAQITYVGGPTGFNYGELGSTTNGLYGLDYSNNLYSINPSTGAPTLIGALGLTQGAGALSTDGTNLYYTDGTDLYSLNTSTAQPTLIGDMGIEISAMVVAGGVLYGADYTPSSIYTLNTTTGQATFVADVSGVPHSIYGMASPQVVPEPSFLGLVGVGFATLMIALRGRTKPSRPAPSTTNAGTALES